MESDPCSLFIPRCILCFSDKNQQGDCLLQINCKHVFCAFCLQTIKGPQGGYVCPIDKGEYFAVWSNKEFLPCLQRMQEGVNRPREEIVGDLELLEGSVNYKGVLCRWPNCVKRVEKWMCPYLHGFNPLATVKCPLGLNCWRREVCPMSHFHQFEVVLRARSISDFLLAQDAAELHSLFSQANMQQVKFTARVQTLPSLSEPRWFYLTDNGPKEFDETSRAVIDAGFVGGAETCKLADGSIVHFLHMTLISPANDYLVLSRLSTLVSYGQHLSIAIETKEGKVDDFQRAVAELHCEKEVPLCVQEDYLRDLAENCGLSVQGGKMCGMKQAVEFAIGMVLPDTPRLFPVIHRFQLPKHVFVPVLEADVRAQGIFIENGFAYGLPEAIEMLQAECKEYEFTADCPPGRDEFDTVLLCSEFGVTLHDGKLVGREAAVRTVLDRLNQASQMIPPGVEEEELAIMMSLFQVQVVGNQLKGEKEEIARALEHLKQRETQADFPTNLPFDVIRTCLEKFQVRLEDTKIAGMKQNVEEAIKYLRDKSVPEDKAIGFQFHVLPEWYLNLDMDVYCEDLPAEHPGFQEASDLFYQTMRGTATIQHIYMIYNKKLYTNFAYKHESKSRVEGRALEIQMLFHGTRQTDPRVIYESEEGLDSRLGGGMWGNGTYYAKNASYSHGFAFHNGGHMLMFLCEVLVGDYIAMNPQALVKPPQKKNSNSYYHSVKGHASGSDIWITYEVSMSYPKFLIEYQAGIR